MPQVCFYFQLHQPYRLGNFNVFDISHDKNYFGEESKTIASDNAQIFQKVTNKSYLPMLGLLKDLLKKHPDFKFALSASGVFLEQAQNYNPEVIELLQDLAKTGRVEFLAETYYHSLSSLYSDSEFKKQIQLHQKLIKKLFNQTPQIFRNTELIYSDEIGKKVAKLGFKGLLTEAVDRYLHGQDRTQVFWANLKNDQKTKKSIPQLPLLLKHAPLSDDIAFRFSDKNWADHPLSAEKYLHWLEIYPQDHIVNLFMDFETFGEHQWEDTGIFKFFEALIGKFLKRNWNKTVTPSEILIPQYEEINQQKDLQPQPVYEVPQPISWADIDRDLTAWVDNDLQQDTLSKLYELEKQVLKIGKKQPQLLEEWRYLQTSDHFYYMCTKWSADGDVHAYFSPYESPFEAYRRYSIVLADLIEKLSLA
jgi:alpha-amylase